MGLFNMRKPRRFHHPYIYVDERRERLAGMEEKARRELGLGPADGKPCACDGNRLRGAFGKHASRPGRRRRGNRPPVSVRTLAVLVLVLLWLWYLLVTF